MEHVRLFVLLMIVIAVHTAKSVEPTCPANGDCGEVKNQQLESFRHRTNPDEPMTTNQGIKIADNQNSLKAGTRGPTLLEDFIMREKITHFDHERIPERIVHARGAAAHGYFQPYENFASLTKAKFLQDPSTITPVFVRFSTVGGSRGSADTVRDVRGFAVKLYTQDGNFDIVGNNIPIFFVQDAMKFPDFVHSVKPEPHNEIPQASSAHDNLWDFIATQTETMHMVMWLMSDRAIPRSYSMMEGFGVHSFRMINDAGNSSFIKFHWKPTLGVNSLIWDEAQKLAGKDADFNRRDLWEQIEKGNFPEWELGVQIIDEDEEMALGYDILDPTKLVPEDRKPIIKLGKMVLNRNPDNYFAETEQVAYCVSNMVPGFDFTNDPLMQGRLHSYLDTQLSRLGGANFHEIPINRPVCPFRANNQRDGIHRQTINVGKTNYDKNTINNGKPAEDPVNGFQSYREPMIQNKIRERSQSFSDHFSQATMFWKSMSGPEQDHIASAFAFELSKVSIVGIRRTILGHLQGVNDTLAMRVADKLGLPLEANLHAPTYPKDVPASAFLSQAPTVKNTIKARNVAFLTADGVDGVSLMAMKQALEAGNATVKVIAPKMGSLKSSSGGDDIQVDATISGSPSILFDAVYIPGGRDATKTLQESGEAVHYALESFVHLKAIAASGEGGDFLAHIGLTSRSRNAPLPDGLIVNPTNSINDGFKDDFIKNIAMHRFYNRERTGSIPA